MNWMLVSRLLFLSLATAVSVHLHDETNNNVIDTTDSGSSRMLAVTRRPSRSRPTGKPVKPPSKKPSKAPIKQPTKKPSKPPSKKPSKAPIKPPTKKPSKNPSKKPSKAPIRSPTKKPSRKPTRKPSVAAATVVSSIFNDIMSLLRTNGNTTKGPLGPKFLRLAFHDCVGGCDGCVDMTNGDNAGLDIPINALAPIVTKYQGQSGVSRADIWAISGLAACEAAARRSNFTFPVNWIGRQNCEVTQSTCYDKNSQVVPCNATRGPNRDLPSPDLTTHQVLSYFLTTFNFNTDETVAIMGAHTLGTAHRENSGFNGTVGWVGNPNALDNAYYAGLVGGNSPNDTFVNLFDGPRWDQQVVNNADLTNIPNRVQWIHAGPNQTVPTIMLNADIGMVRDMTDFLNGATGQSRCLFACGNRLTCPPNGPPACPFASQTFNLSVAYKFNNTLWLTDFKNAFNKMIANGYSTSDGCVRPPCILLLK